MSCEDRRGETMRCQDVPEKPEEVVPSCPESAAAISADRVSKCYHIYERPQDRLKQGLWFGRRSFFKPFWALRDFSIDIPKGLSVGLIGLNGSGKTTLLQLVAGIITPSTGTLKVNGRIAALLELGSGFNPEFTGRENIYLYGSLFQMSRSEIEGRLPEIIGFADIGEFINQPVKTYSSGMFLRLAFSVVVHVDFETLLVDEAIAVGDALFQLKCYQRIHELKKRGKTLILVSHDLGVVHQLCDRAILLHQGQCVRFGDLKDVTEIYTRDILRLGSIETSTVQVKDSTNLRLGDNSMNIARYWVENHVGSSPVFKYGEEVNVFLEVVFNEDIGAPIVGLINKTLAGYEISGYNNWYQGESLSPQKKGSKSQYKISFKMLLNPGDFYMTLACAHIKDSEVVRSDYIECAFSFKVLPKQMLWSGLVDFGFSVTELGGDS
jgi:ABC-type polysaccharide/polyol phosphate transport system ATPase subunit